MPLLPFLLIPCTCFCTISATAWIIGLAMLALKVMHIDHYVGALMPLASFTVA